MLVSVATQRSLLSMICLLLLFNNKPKICFRLSLFSVHNTVQGIVATPLRFRGIFNKNYCKFTNESISARFLSGLHLAKLRTIIQCPVFDS